MSPWTSIEDILDYAIEREREAVFFYNDLADKAGDEGVKEVLRGFATEEKGHEEKLIHLKQDGINLLPQDDLVKMTRISGAVSIVEPDPETMTYEDALQLAITKEASAYKLYSDLADSTEIKVVQDVFLALAREEAKHRERFAGELQKLKGMHI